MSMLSFPESVLEKIKISKNRHNKMTFGNKAVDYLYDQKKIALFAETKDIEWTRKRT